VRPRFSVRSSWLLRAPPGSAEAYLIATVLVVIASLARWGLGFFGAPLLPFTAYYPAILFAAYFGGLQVSIFAAILGGLIGSWAFLPPYFMFVYTPTRAFELLAYLCACALIIWGANSYRRLVDRLQDEEKLRKLAVDELAHRLKNKIASIQAIISYQLRDHPEIRDGIAARLAALSGTDDLIMESQGHGAGIRDIIFTELRPYELSRISMAGPNVVLAPTLALTIALLVHELATNAAKYGALSTPAGKLSIHWSISHRTLDLEWRESGGPTVASAIRQGFGLRLLSRALDQFGGSTAMTFEPTGVVCKISARLPEDAPSIVPAEMPTSSGAP
jgi:two-component sensor histidine kinase